MIGGLNAQEDSRPPIDSGMTSRHVPYCPPCSSQGPAHFAPMGWVSSNLLASRLRSPGPPGLQVPLALCTPVLLCSERYHGVAGLPISSAPSPTTHSRWAEKALKTSVAKACAPFSTAFIHEAPAVCQSRGPGPRREAAVSIKCFVPPGTWASGGLGRRARARWLLAPGGSLPPSFRQPQRPSPSPSSHEGVTFPARHVER